MVQWQKACRCKAPLSPDSAVNLLRNGLLHMSDVGYATEIGVSPYGLKQLLYSLITVVTPDSRSVP